MHPQSESFGIVLCMLNTCMFNTKESPLQAPAVNPADEDLDSDVMAELGMELAIPPPPQGGPTESEVVPAFSSDDDAPLRPPTWMSGGPQDHLC